MGNIFKPQDDSSGGLVDAPKYKTVSQDEMNSMDMNALKDLASADPWKVGQSYGPGLGGVANFSGIQGQAQSTWDNRRMAEIKQQTDAANAQRASAEEASRQAAKVAESAAQQRQYTQQGQTQSQVQNVNALNVQSQIRDYQNKSPEQASADVSQVTADGADGGSPSAGAEDQRKRPGGFTNRPTGIRIS